MNPFLSLLNTKIPIIGAPMFLVSNPQWVAAISNAGALGAIPALNFRSTALLDKGLQEIKQLTSQPFAVNLIVNQANPRQMADLDMCVKHQVPMIITSLGNPQHVIEKMHRIHSKVFCDVVNLEYAKKVQDYGADGVIAVAAGAGGHAGSISPLVLIPYLAQHLQIPIVAAGGIATGAQMFAALALGASAVQIGTRFIACTEADVEMSYKNAILKAQPEDIVLTKKISGTPAAVINTAYIQQQGLELNWIEKTLMKHPFTKKYLKMLIAYLGSQTLKTAASQPTWKTVWSAGQGVGLIEDIQPAKKIIESILEEYNIACQKKYTPYFIEKS